MIEEYEVEANTIVVQICLNFAFVFALAIYSYVTQDWAKIAEDELDPQEDIGDDNAREN